MDRIGRRINSGALFVFFEFDKTVPRSRMRGGESSQLTQDSLMKRILVIGSGGAGKSTFAKRLGEILELKVIHLDSLFWSGMGRDAQRPVASSG